MSAISSAQLFGTRLKSSLGVINLFLTEKCDSGLCFPINSSAQTDRKYAPQLDKNCGSRKKKGKMTDKNCAAAAGLQKKLKIYDKCRHHLLVLEKKLC